MDARTRLATQLAGSCTTSGPGWSSSKARSRRAATQQQIARRLSRAEPTIRVRAAGDIIRRIRDLTCTIDELQRELADLVASRLLAEEARGASPRPS